VSEIEEKVSMHNKIDVYAGERIYSSFMLLKCERRRKK